jgi:hypothetical protein
LWFWLKKILMCCIWKYSIMIFCLFFNYKSTDCRHSIFCVRPSLHIFCKSDYLFLKLLDLFVEEIKLDKNTKYMVEVSIMIMMLIMLKMTLYIYWVPTICKTPAQVFYIWYYYYFWTNDYWMPKSIICSMYIRYLNNILEIPF